MSLMPGFEPEPIILALRKTLINVMALIKTLIIVMTLKKTLINVMTLRKVINDGFALEFTTNAGAELGLYYAPHCAVELRQFRGSSRPTGYSKDCLPMVCSESRHDGLNRPSQYQR